MTFGPFDDLSVSAGEEALRKTAAQDSLQRAIVASREEFGSFLGQANDLHDYKARCGLVKNDLMKVISSYEMPIPRVVKAVERALRPEFSRAAGYEDSYQPEAPQALPDRSDPLSETRDEDFEDARRERTRRASQKPRQRTRGANRGSATREAHGTGARAPHVMKPTRIKPVNPLGNQTMGTLEDEMEGKRRAASRREAQTPDGAPLIPDAVNDYNSLPEDDQTAMDNNVFDGPSKDGTPVTRYEAPSAVNEHVTGARDSRIDPRIDPAKLAARQARIAAENKVKSDNKGNCEIGSCGEDATGKVTDFSGKDRNYCTRHTTQMSNLSGWAKKEGMLR